MTTHCTPLGEDKTERNTLVLSAGRDSVMNFDFGNKVTSDFVEAVTGYTGTSISGGDVIINNLTLKDGVNEIIQGHAWGRDWTVEFGNDLTYAESVEMYGDVYNENNKLTLSDESTSADTAIYMNGEEYMSSEDGVSGLRFDGKYYYNVNEVDASGFSHNVSIAGNDNVDDTLTGGTGSNSLWGGIGGNDLINAGSGTNEIFYLFGDGNDTVGGAKSGDIINLFNIDLSDINLEESVMNLKKQIVFKMNDGGSLTVKGDINNLDFKIGADTYRRSE